MGDEKSEKQTKGGGQDLRKDLNQLWKSTIDQFDELKDVVVRSGSAGKAKLDSTFQKRQREKLLAEIGERLLQAASDGAFTLPDDVASKVESLSKLDDEIAENNSEVDRLLRPDDASEPKSDASAD